LLLFKTKSGAAGKWVLNLNNFIEILNLIRLKKSIVFLLLSFPACLYAQEADDRNWILKLNAARLFDIFSFPTVQVSAERKINPWVSVGADLGLQVYELYKPDTVFLKPRGFKANVEGRVYLPMLIKGRTIPKKRGEIYVGLQLFYNQNQATKSLSYYPVNDSTKTIGDYYGAKITAWGANLIFGYQVSRGRFVLEPYAGLGLTSRKVKNSNIEYDKTKHNRRGTDLVPYFQYLTLEESSGTSEHVTIGFRIGYRF
jgi:hypothetical protein